MTISAGTRRGHVLRRISPLPAQVVSVFLDVRWDAVRTSSA